MFEASNRKHRSSHPVQAPRSQQGKLERDVERLSRDNERLRQELIERDRKPAEAEKQISEAGTADCGSRTEVGSAATKLSYVIEAAIVRPPGWGATQEGREEGQVAVSLVARQAIAGTDAAWRRRIP
jgi:hypothetical protein